MTRDIPRTYQPGDVERKWYSFWEERGYFRPTGQGSVFSIVIPPPNVTGSLHMGHALNVTLQDILVRWKRMQGFDTLWLPGTDHAGIATQNVVERQLLEEGLHRRELGRQAFEKRVWQWKEQSEDRILNQIRRLGSSCDWSRKRFTLDEGLSRAVREVFVQLYEEGLIYRGEYLINWCPRCETAISDLEVQYEPVQGQLWDIRYPVKGGSAFLTVATTRPETMLGDSAVAVHSEDDRYRSYIGSIVVLPLLNREIPIVADSFVDKEFGTGVVKVTPGHDPNDFEAGRRHELPVIKVIGEDGRMTNKAGPYAGLDRFEARRRVIEDLSKLGLLERVQEHLHSVGHCQRCNTVIEPLVSTQWFVRVQPPAEVAIRAVEEGRTVFVPERYARVYFEWMRNIHDWCISRQLWWGHRIPAWYCRVCGSTTVSRTDPQSCQHCGSAEIEQESDVLDTWFSSALWPFSTLGWPEETPDLKRYYPTSTLVTGFDIIFFWVARMMMMGLRFRGDVPFRTVYINGLVRDEKGQKMSKSRGNIIDPLEVVEEYGTDAIRFTLSVMAVPGTDIPFSVSRMSGYRAFCNKIWNAGRFLLLSVEETQAVEVEEIEKLRREDQLNLEERWILSRLQSVIGEVNRDLEGYGFHEASNRLYHFFWHEFCDWYIEFSKSGISSSDPNRRRTAQKVAVFLMETALRLLHPFIPFITEELWQRLPHRGETIMLAPYPEAREDWIDETAVSQMESLQDFITSLRTVRAKNNLEPRKPIPAEIICSSKARDFLESQAHHLERLGRLKSIRFVSRFDGQGPRLQGVSKLAEFSLQLEDLVDLKAERERLFRQVEKLREDVSRQRLKLENSDFLRRAPKQVVNTARERFEGDSEQLRKLEAKLADLERI